jgi:uncharacterized membrane protein
MNLLYQLAGVVVLYAAGWTAGYAYASGVSDWVILVYVFFMSFIAKMLFDEGYDANG